MGFRALGFLKVRGFAEDSHQILDANFCNHLSFLSYLVSLLRHIYKHQGLEFRCQNQYELQDLRSKA